MLFSQSVYARSWLGVRTPVDVTGPQLVMLPVPHSRELRPKSLKVPGMGPQGRKLWQFLGHFGGFGVHLACSRRKDPAWSGGKAEIVSFFAFFAKSVYGVHAVDVRFHVIPC
ncbi:hypothetical protein Taro_031316 [Colocasia esculenta]|uniref:Uncharacterized protein n=1 Tax=Colocasia esculenta TaxID=4460 RepID=A0A843W2T2_COLES|nr:hypothetical protein [Colocasia esculenta]